MRGQKAGGLVMFTSQLNAGELSGETCSEATQESTQGSTKALPLEWPSSQPKESGHLPSSPPTIRPLPWPGT